MCGTNEKRPAGRSVFCYVALQQQALFEAYFTSSSSTSNSSAAPGGIGPAPRWP